MTTLRVRRLHTHGRLPVGAGDERARLDRAIRGAVDDGMLDAALASVDAPHEIVCVRRVGARVRVRRGTADAALATAWSRAVAEAIDAAIRDGRDVVRYATRHHALLDVARRAPTGDVARAWAWRRIGLWTLSDASGPADHAREVVASLTRESRAAVPVLATLAHERAEALGILLRAVDVSRWEALVAAALASFGASDTLLRESAIDEARRSALASDAATAPRRVGALAARFAAALRDVPHARRDALARALAAIALLDDAPHVARDDHARLAAAIDRAHRDLLADAEAATVRDATQIASRREPLPPAVDEDDAPLDDRRPRATTDAAGLLFLLHLVRALDLPRRIAASAPLADRAPRWVMHRLAVDMLGLDETDAAALAFVGLAPDADAPSRDAPPPSDAEQAALGALRDALVAALLARLPDDGSSDAARVARVCARRGEIVADLGWIEAHIPLASVDADVRRAGLDVDPGWCDWIGAVVRIVYV